MTEFQPQFTTKKRMHTASLIVVLNAQKIQRFYLPRSLRRICTKDIFESPPLTTIRGDKNI